MLGIGPARAGACRVLFRQRISSRRLVFIVTWWSEGLMLVVEIVVMALAFHRNGWCGSHPVQP
jgi:hypothetical protein